MCMGILIQMTTLYIVAGPASNKIQLSQVALLLLKNRCSPKTADQRNYELNEMRATTQF